MGVGGHGSNPLQNSTFTKHLASDHFTTVSNFDLATLPPPSPLPPRWNTRKTDRDLFSNVIAEKIYETSHTNLEQHTAHVTNAFQTAANEVIPRTKRPKKAYKDYWFRDERVEAINKGINAARKCWRRNPTEDKRTS